VGDLKMTTSRKGPSAQYRGSKQKWDNGKNIPANKKNSDRATLRANRIKRLKRKRAALIVVMILILIALIFLIRAAYIQFRPKASESTLTLRNDGSIRLEEVIDMNAYKTSKGDIKKSIKKEISSFNKTSKTGKVSYIRISTKDDKTYLETTYKNVSTYKAYTDYDMYSGTVKKAVKSGLDFNASFTEVKDGKKGSQLAVDKVKKLTGNVLKIDENIVVKVPGDVIAVSGDNTKVQDTDQVKITSQDGNSDSAEVTYIIYR
jgi:hypothetical protein